jgi:hypothetical protein
MRNLVSVRRLHDLCLNLLLAAASTHAADLYVSTQGSDSNPGTSALPFQTITYAYSRASAGTTIHVLPGVYYDYTSGWGIHLGNSGTAANPIVLHSETRGGAVIDGQNFTDRNVGFYIDGTYNTVDGFEIRNCIMGGITIWANNNRIINNNIHDNGTPASTSTLGRSGIYSSDGTSGNYYAANSIHDNGRTGSNLDHGMYLCGQNETVINNLLFRNVGAGLQIAGYTTVSNMGVYNNVMAWNGTTGIILWMALNGVDIKNNIIYQNGHYGIGCYQATGSGVVADHNLSYANAYGNYDWSGGGTSTLSYTLGTSIASDPKFVNDTSASFDPHLASGSPCIGAGLNLYSVFTTDINGTARPSSGAWDLGAYVYGSGSANTPPTISSIANQSITVGSATSPLAFTVGDAQTSASQLTVSGSCADPTFVPTSSIVFGGSGANRTVTVTPAANQTGMTTITLTVSDGPLSTSTSFTLTVNALAAPVVTLTSPVNGASYSAPATINLAASITANGHTITQVQFYSDSTLLGTDTATPYTFAWSNVSAGSYTLSVKVLYDLGSTVASTPVSVTVAAPPPAGSLTFASTSGTISTPFYVTNSAIVQPAYTSLTAAGQAVYAFNIATAGNYVASALVNAPTTDNNSFFVNIDGQPTDPTMVWDVPVTTGFASQTVAWRGNGTASTTDPSGIADQYQPAVFTFSAGAHQLIIRGREGNCQLGTITIAPYGQNTPPSISGIVNQTITAGGSTGSLAFTVGDAQVAASSLTVSASSSNPTLVPNANIVFGGSGANRTVTVTPANGQTGTATITLTVSDGSLSSSTSFTLTVNAAPAPVVTLTSPVGGSSYTAPATISLTASVTANGHTINQVQFYNGATLLGAATAAPYGFTWSGVNAGSYALSATANYDSGRSVASASASVTVTAPPPAGNLTFASTSGTLSAPFYITNNAIDQPAYTTLLAGGQATYTFSLSSAGDYVVSALVSAPTTDNNSLFVNIDAQPTDPTMIWDVPVRSGFASQMVSWRGNGTVSSSSPSGIAAQYAPKVFSLATGTHQLIVRGREGNCQLGTITIAPTSLPAN